MSVCHHGRHINESWMECPNCLAEHDLREAADAAQDSLAESRRQTEILENIASRGAATSNEDAAQQKAIFAANRYTMGDLLGAVQLISDAIGLDSNFPSFLLQRAKYLSQQGRNKEAVADLRQLFEKDLGILVECEARPVEGHVDEHAGIRTEINVAIEELTEIARRAAAESLTSAQREIERMREAFREVPWPELVTGVDGDYQRLVATVKSGSYRALMDVPRRVRLNAEAARAAISGSPSGIEQGRRYEEQRRRDELVGATKSALGSIAMAYAQESAEADILYKEAERLVKLSKDDLAADSLEGLQRALDFARQARDKASAADRIGGAARSARIEKERLAEVERERWQLQRKNAQANLASVATFLAVVCAMGSTVYLIFHRHYSPTLADYQPSFGGLFGTIGRLLAMLFGVVCALAMPVVPFLAAAWMRDRMKQRAGIT